MPVPVPGVGAHVPAYQGHFCRGPSGMGMSGPAQGGRSPLWEGGEAGHTQGPAHPSSKSTHLSCPAAGLPVSQEVRRADRKLGNQVQSKGMRDAGDTAISDDPAEQLSRFSTTGRELGFPAPLDYRTSITPESGGRPASLPTGDTAGWDQGGGVDV